MKGFSVRFLLIKLAVTALVNIIMLVCAVLLTLIFGSLEPVTLPRLIASGVSGVLFYAYMYASSRTLKNPDGLSLPLFTLREGMIGAVYGLIPAVLMLIMGTASFTNYIFMFFMPCTFFYYLTENAVIGYIIHTLLFVGAVLAARLTPPKSK